MMFAYGIHFKQIANAPRWLETDKYDVTLLQAGEGQPSDAQLKEMVRKLLFLSHYENSIPAKRR